MDVSVIIVNYNTLDLTRNCLKSIYEQTKDINFEVIVSDNGSVDGSIEMIRQDFPQVVLIENNANLGFGAANNRGLKIARGKYIFYLNSDTILLNNAIKIFYDYWEGSENKDSIGALGTNLMDKELNVIHSGGQYPSYKSTLIGLIKFFVAELWLYRKIPKKKKENLFYPDGKWCGYITGADLFVLNNESAYFDENFFMYYEETDLQYNSFKKKGLDCWLLKEPKIIHFGGGSDACVLNTRFAKKSNFYNWESAIKYLRKNCGCGKTKIRIFKIVLIFIYLYHFKFCRDYLNKIWKV